MRANETSSLSRLGSRSFRGAVWALAAALASAALGVSAVTAAGRAPATPELTPPPSLYSGRQTPDLPREWRWVRPAIRLDDPPPRLQP